MAAKARTRRLGQAFTVIETSMEEIDLPPSSADLVVAMGSLQYTYDPPRAVGRFAEWTRPGGWVCVLVDSLLSRLIELIREQRIGEARVVSTTRRGTWAQRGHAADLHLLDTQALLEAFAAVDLRDVHTSGLIVSATVLGVPAFVEGLAADPDGQLGRERLLAADPRLTDLGKHVLVWGRKRS